MRIGEEAKVTCPPSMAYGSYAQGNIPPNSTLTFDMEIMDCESTDWATLEGQEKTVFGRVFKYKVKKD